MDKTLPFAYVFRLWTSFFYWKFFFSEKQITLEEKKLDYEFLKICRKLFLFVSSHKTGTEAAAQKCSLGGMGVLLVFSCKFAAYFQNTFS